MSGGVLLPYQQTWIADKSPVKIYEKSRRIGASWAEAADCVLLAATQQPQGMDCWYIGYNKDMAKEFILDCAFWAGHFGEAASEVDEQLINDGKKDIITFVITFASGNRVTALSSRPSNLRGKQGKVIIDEAAFHDDLQGLLKAALALLIWGGQVVILSTHDGVENYYNELILECRSGRKKYSVHRTTFDEALDQGLYKQICLVKGEEWSRERQDAWRQNIRDDYGEAAEEELDCIPSKTGGKYFSSSLIESCMDPEIPVIRYEAPAGFELLDEQTRARDINDWLVEQVNPALQRLDQTRPSYFGEDFGRSGDLTVIWPLQKAQNLQLTTPFIVELRNVPFRNQEQILFFIVDNLPGFVHGSMDARGNGQALAEFAADRYGPDQISQVMLTTKWYGESMPRYKAAYEDRLLSVPQDRDILADHRTVEVIQGIPRIGDKRTTSEHGGKRHGDSCVAGCMAVAASREEDCSLSFGSVPRDNVWGHRL